MQLTRTLAVVLTCLAGWPACGQDVTSTQVPTSLIEDGTAVQLELVMYKPPGSGPFPTLLFTHGSVDNGNDMREVRYTVAYPELASFFNDNGWLVALLQRRGRGKSTGAFAEGWDSKQGRYACDVGIAQASQQRGLADLDAAYTFLESDSRVDRSRILVGGNSQGGVLALLHAARHPDLYVGVVNFVGGWSGQRCGLMQEINHQAAATAATFTRRTVWLYGQRDPLYGPDQSKAMFLAFTNAGGRGAFHMLSAASLRNDHQIIRARQEWEQPLAEYLRQVR